MTFKDLIRLLRRHWLKAFAVAALVFGAFLYYTLTREQPLYRARAKVLISTPPFFALPQAAQWMNFESRDMNTWISLMTGKDIRAKAQAILAAAYPTGVAADLRPIPEGQQLVWIEASAATPQAAADVANAYARASQDWSYENANEERTKALVNLARQITDEQKVRRDEEFHVQKLRDAARTLHGSENLEADVAHFQREVQAHEARLREIDRRAASNRLRLERVREDRSVKEHLERGEVPRLPSASVESRLQESPRVRGLADRLEGLHREHHALSRRYTPAHPSIKGIRADLREAELELTREQFAALGRDIDREEIALRADTELLSIEGRVLDPELRNLRHRLTALVPQLDLLRTHERSASDAKTRADQMESLRNQLSNTPLGAGYVSVLEEEKATPGETTRVEPRLRRMIPVAALGAIILGISFAFLVDFLDTSLRNDYDVRRHLDYPVLGVIPRAMGTNPLILRAGRASALPEIFDTLGTVLLSLPSENPTRLFVVTSTNPEEGKSSVSTNLAVALARQGKRTLLVDGDLRIPSIHSILGLPNDVGLGEILAQQASLATEGILRETEVPNLKALTSGVIPENPYELLETSRLTPLAALLREQFEAIVVDTPPVLRMGDALKFSSVADSVIFVVLAGKTEQRQATWAKRLLTNVHAKVAGVVLNGATAESQEYYYYDSRSPRKQARVL